MADIMSQAISTLPWSLYFKANLLLIPGIHFSHTTPTVLTSICIEFTAATAVDTAAAAVTFALRKCLMVAVVFLSPGSALCPHDCSSFSLNPETIHFSHDWPVLLC